MRNLVWSFVPWFVFLVVYRVSSLETAAVVGMVAAMVVFGRALVDHRIHLFDVAGLLYFLRLGIALVVLTPATVETLGRVRAARIAHPVHRPRHTLQRGEMRIHPFGLPADSYSWSPQTRSVLVKTDRRVVAHVGVLYRVITVSGLRVPVGGLGGVMTSRVAGTGLCVSRWTKATAFVGMQLWARFALVICPRGDTDFYNHLGWRAAEAPIWCKQPRWTGQT